MAQMRLDTLIAFPDGRVLRLGEMRAEDGEELAELYRRHRDWSSQMADLHERALELIVASGRPTLGAVDTDEPRALIAEGVALQRREPFEPLSFDDLIERVRQEHPGADADTLTRALFEEHAAAVEPYARALGGPDGLFKLLAGEMQ